MPHMIRSRNLMTVVLAGMVVSAVPARSDAQTSPTAWADLSTLRLETKVKLTLVGGDEVTGNLVQVTTDDVTLTDFETGKSGIRTASWASRAGDVTVLRSQVQTIEILKPKGARSIAFADLTARLKPGDGVYVTDTAGNEATGRLVDVGPSTLRVRVGGTEHEWAAVDVREVGKRSDSPFTGGSFFGLAIGVGLITPPAIAYRERGTLVWSALFGGIGYGIGIGVDALIRHRQPIYWAPFQQRVSVAPILTHERQGARITLKF